MTLLTTIITCTAVTSVVTILVKAIWDWASNKSGKKEMTQFKTELKKEWLEIKNEIKEQRKEFEDLKNLIILEYVHKRDFEKLSEQLFKVRDITITNKNNIDMIKESSKQNLERMSSIENRILKLE